MTTETATILARCVDWFVFSVFIVCGAIAIEIALRKGGKP